MLFNRMRFIVVLLFLFLLTACGRGSTPAYVIYDAEFDDSTKIEQIEFRIRNIAQKKGLTIIEKNRNEMSIVTRGKPAFFIFLEYNNRTVLTIGNAGPGTILRLDSTDYGELPTAELDKLIAEVITSLSELGLEFRKLPTEPRKSK